MRGIARLLYFILRSCKFELTASLQRSRSWFSSPLQLVLLQAQHRPDHQMGCCGSKAAVEENNPLSGTGICQKQLFPLHTSPTGLQAVFEVLHRKHAAVSGQVTNIALGYALAGEGLHSQLGGHLAVRRVLCCCTPRNQYFPCDV